MNPGNTYQINWQGVPIDAPGTTITRIIRITNVRANACNLSGNSTSLLPQTITELIGVSGSTTIIVNNPLQTVALAEKGGVDRAVALDAVLKSVAASPVLGYRGPFILDGAMPKVPLADVTLQQKDMLLALNLGRTLGSPVPLAAAANEMMNACRGLGIDGNDFVVAHQVYRRLGGQT